LISAPRLSQNEQVDETLLQAGIDIGRMHRDLQQHGAENTSRSAEAISPRANELNPSPNLTTATRPASHLQSAVLPSSDLGHSIFAYDLSAWGRCGTAA